MSKLGEAIRERRLEQGLSQDALARLADVPTTTLVKIETGQTDNPTIRTVSQLADALGVTVTDLLSSESNHDKSTTGAR